MMNKNKLTNIKPSSEIFSILTKLNIDFSSIERNSKNSFSNAYVNGYFQSLNFLNTELKDILNDKDLTSKQKQNKLEKFSETSQTFKLELTYNVPISLSKRINELDSYLLNPSYLRTEDPSPYLPSSLASNLGEHDIIKKSYKKPEIVDTINFFKDILKVFIYMDNSLGLFLVYKLTTFLRSDVDALKLKSKIEKNKLRKKKVVFNELDEDGHNNFFLNFKRVDITETFGKDLVTVFVRLKNACLYELSEKAIPNILNYEDLSLKDKIDAVSLELKKQDFASWELFEMLQTKYSADIIDQEKTARLGIYCVTLLEVINVLVDDGLVRGKLKTFSKIKIAKYYANDIFSIPSRPKNLPMIVRPRFWKDVKESGDGNLNYGGYQFNKSLNYPAILNHHSKGVTVITKDDLKSINYLQSNYYSINKPFLKEVENNFKVIVDYFLRKIPNSSFFIKNIDDNLATTVKLQSLNELLSSDAELRKLVKQFKKQSTGNNKSLKKKLIERQEYLTSQYKDVVNIFFGLLHSYIIASNYQNYNFYFVVFLDSRGRIYYTSAGSDFGLQNGDFAKALIDLKGNNYKNNVLIKQKYSLKNKHYLNYLKSLDRNKEPFQHFRATSGMPPTAISNDASCSGTSILSGLVGFKKGLVLTNVLAFKKSVEEKQCIYTYFLNFMKEDYPTDVFSLYNSDQVEIKSRDLKIDKEDFIGIIHEGLRMIKFELLRRDHAKQFVMRKNYSESNKGRRDYIYDNIFKKLMYVTYEEFPLLYKQVYLSLAYKLAVWIEQIYFSAFPEIARLCEIIQSKFKNTTRPITLSCPQNSKFQYQQLMFKTYKLNRTNVNSFRNSNLNMHIQTNEIDFARIERSIVANLCHYLDSRLNLHVINKCRLNSIPLITNHDCFYVCPTKKDEILKYYYDSYVKLLINEDVISYFFKENYLLDQDIDNNLIDEINNYTKNRTLILKEIKSGKATMSNFILSS